MPPFKSRRGARRAGSNALHHCAINPKNAEEPSTAHSRSVGGRGAGWARDQTTVICSLRLYLQYLQCRRRRALAVRCAVLHYRATCRLPSAVPSTVRDVLSVRAIRSCHNRSCHAVCHCKHVVAATALRICIPPGGGLFVKAAAPRLANSEGRLSVAWLVTSQHHALHTSNTVSYTSSEFVCVNTCSRSVWAARTLLKAHIARGIAFGTT